MFEPDCAMILTETMPDSFCTLINCMDGRVQRLVHDFVRDRFAADFVDVITEPGAVRFFSEHPSPLLRSILNRLDISIRVHGSEQLAIAAHHDCAGNPVPEVRQQEQLCAAVDFLAHRYPDMEVIGVWVDESWSCSETD